MSGTSDVFKALADETRVRIVHLLLLAEEPLCCCELTDALGEPQYKISKHTRVLKQAGLLEERREGRWVYFSVPEAADLFRRNLYRSLVTIRQFNDRVREDELNLRKRLEMRVGGKCVIGSGRNNG